MATLEQIAEALRKADAAGNVEDARALANAYRQMQAQQGAEPSQDAVGYSGGDAFRSGMTQGATFGFADEILGTMMAPIEMGIDAFQGKPFDPGRSWNQAVERNRQTDELQQAEDPNLAMTGQIMGGVGTGASLARSGVTLMNAAKPTVASIAPRIAAEGGMYGAAHGFGSGETLEDRAWGALEGGTVGAVTGGFLGTLAGMIAGRSANKAVPSVEELKAQAGALYDAARQSGAVAPQQATQALNQTMKGIATAEGLITPTGRVNQSYPRISGVLNTFDDFAAGTMDVAQAQAVRKVLTDAAKSTEPGERRIATIMLEQFDQFLDPLAPQIAQANQIYSRAMKGETLETAIELAGSRAGQFSGSGFENALRTEFRALQRQIIKGQMRGLTEAEIDAINKVANGGPVENALRMVGKLAPTGVVSMGMGGGVPFAIGNAFGGPGVGAAAAAGTMGAGMLARGGATAMTANNARQAVAAALMAGQAPAAANPAIAPVAQALVAGGSTQAPSMREQVMQALMR